MKLIKCAVVVGVPDDSDVDPEGLINLVVADEGTMSMVLDFHPGVDNFVVYRTDVVVKQIELRDPDDDSNNGVGESILEDAFVYQNNVTRWYETAETIIKREAHIE